MEARRSFRGRLPSAAFLPSHGLRFSLHPLIHQHHALYVFLFDPLASVVYHCRSGAQSWLCNDSQHVVSHSTALITHLVQKSLDVL